MKTASAASHCLKGHEHSKFASSENPSRSVPCALVGRKFHLLCLVFALSVNFDWGIPCSTFSKEPIAHVDGHYACKFDIAHDEGGLVAAVGSARFNNMNC